MPVVDVRRPQRTGDRQRPDLVGAGGRVGAHALAPGVAHRRQPPLGDPFRTVVPGVERVDHEAERDDDAEARHEPFRERAPQRRLLGHTTTAPAATIPSSSAISSSSFPLVSGM